MKEVVRWTYEQVCYHNRKSTVSLVAKEVETGNCTMEKYQMKKAPYFNQTFITPASSQGRRNEGFEKAFVCAPFSAL